MVFGMFLLNPARKYGFRKLYFTKILRIATAFLFWATFYPLVSMGILWLRGGEMSGHSVLHVLVLGILGGHYHMWVLFMISGLYIVTPFLRLIAKDEKLTIYFLVLSLVFVFGTNMINLLLPHPKAFQHLLNRLDVNLVTGYSGYFIWGYWLSKHRLFATARKTIYCMGLFAAVGTAGLNGLAGYHFDITGTWMYDNLLPNILLMATAVFVFCQYYYHEKQLSPQWQKGIALVGRWSF